MSIWTVTSRPFSFFSDISADVEGEVLYGCDVDTSILNGMLFWLNEKETSNQESSC